MQLLGLVDLGALVLNDEVHLQGSQELLRRQPVEVFHHTVVVEDGELRSLETHSHKVVVLLTTRMVGVLPLLLGSHQCGSCRAMMAVSNVHRGHLGKLLGDGLQILLITDHPELMAEAVDGGNEVVLRLSGGITHDEVVEHSVVGIGEEHGLDVGIVHTDVLHAIFLLVTSCQLVLLDASLNVVVHECPHHETILRLALHGLCVNIIMFLFILHQPAAVLELLEVLSSLFIDTRVIFARAHREVYLGFDDVVQALLVVASLSACLFAVQHVVGAALHLFYQFFGWTDATKRFDCCHCCLKKLSECLKLWGQSYEKSREEQNKYFCFFFRDGVTSPFLMAKLRKNE